MLDFDIDDAKFNVFGVGKGNKKNPTFLNVRINANVQSTLQDLTRNTWEAMQRDSDVPLEYSPAELYPSTRHVIVGIDDYEVASLKDLHSATNIPTCNDLLQDAHRNHCYFARFKDKQGRYLTALRRTSQFKGSLSEKHILLRYISDTLTIERDNLFKLENDFDFLIDSRHIHIWRPQGFVTLGNLNQEILDAVPLNVAKIQQSIPFVDMESIQEFASTNLNAAKRLKSVCSQQLDGIVREKLISECCSAEVKLTQVNGMLLVGDGHEFDFLDVLDRRRFSVSLIEGATEKFRATGRDILN